MKDLYLLVDGTHADPDECDVGADNELRHANGLAVALREDGLPQTVSQGAEDNKNIEAAQAGYEAERSAKVQQSEAAGDPIAKEAPKGDDDLLLKTDDVAPEAPAPKPTAKPAKAKAPKPAKAKTYTNRELKAR